MGKHLTGIRHIRQVATTNESRLVSIADIHTLHDSVRRMARSVRNVWAETTSQSCVGFRGSRKPGGKSVHTVDSNDTSELFIGTVFVGGIDRNEWHTMLKVNERDITFKLDTGADANVLPLDVYQQVLSDVPMTRTDTILTAFGNSKIRPEGEVKLEVKCQETSTTKRLSFYVTSASAHL